MGADKEAGIREATVEDFVEDLYLTVQELLIRGIPASNIKRYFNQSLRGQAPAPIRDRTAPP